MRAGAARKSGRCWKSLGGCRCSLASKALRPVRWRLQTANRRVPTADDSHCSCPLFAWVGSRGDWRFRNPPARGRHQLHFPALARRVGYCPRAATQCCPSRRWTFAESLALPRAAGFGTARAAAATPPMCSAYSPAGRSSPVYRVQEHSLFPCVDSSRHSPGGLPGRSSPAYCALERSVFPCVGSSRHSLDGLPGCSLVSCQCDRRSGHCY